MQSGLVVALGAQPASDHFRIIAKIRFKASDVFRICMSDYNLVQLRIIDDDLSPDC